MEFEDFLNVSHESGNDHLSRLDTDTIRVVGLLNSNNPVRWGRVHRSYSHLTEIYFRISKGNNKLLVIAPFFDENGDAIGKDKTDRRTRELCFYLSELFGSPESDWCLSDGYEIGEGPHVGSIWLRYYSLSGSSTISV